MLKRQRYIMIVSFDGLASSDWKAINELPNFSRFLQEAGYCRKVYTVYPSLTYPAHVSIVTGRYPVHHGVTNNTKFQPKRLTRPDWCWDRKLIHGKTLYDLAGERDMTTAAYLWPVTGSAHITYNLPEVFSNRWWDNQILTSLRKGSFLFQIQAALRYGRLIAGSRQPQLDDFMHRAAMYCLQTRSPQVNFFHYVDLDSTRHRTGHDSQEAKLALKRHDTRLGQLMRLFESQGIQDQVTWALLGDHSSLDEHTALFLNRLFLDKGWIRLNHRGTVADWKVLMKHCDGSAYIYVKEQDLMQEVRDTLESFSIEHERCIERIFSASQAMRLGAAKCSYMVEAKRGYYFMDGVVKPAFYPLHDDDFHEGPHMTRSTHGYLPCKKGYTTIFAMKGPGIRTGEVIESMRLVDEGPTLARIIGGELPQADGREIAEFWKE